MLVLMTQTVLAVSPYSYPKLKIKLEQSIEYRTLRNATEAPRIPLTAYEMASRGEVATGVEHTGSGPKKGWGVAVFPLNIEKIWAGINDEFANSDYSPVSYTAVVSGERCKENRTVTMVLPLPIISDRWWMIDLHTNPQLAEMSNNSIQELYWKEVSDPNLFTLDEKTKTLTDGQVYIDFSRGAWFLIALDEEHTLGEYYSWADPGGYIPAGVTTFAANSIVNTFEGMERFTKESPNLKCLN